MGLGLGTQASSSHSPFPPLPLGVSPASSCYIHLHLLISGPILASASQGTELTLPSSVPTSTNMRPSPMSRQTLRRGPESKC